MKVDLVGIDLMRIDLVCYTIIYNFKLSTNIKVARLSLGEGYQKRKPGVQS